MPSYYEVTGHWFDVPEDNLSTFTLSEFDDFVEDSLVDEYIFFYGESRSEVMSGIEKDGSYPLDDFIVTSVGGFVTL